MVRMVVTGHERLTVPSQSLGTMPCISSTITKLIQARIGVVQPPSFPVATAILLQRALQQNCAVFGNTALPLPNKPSVEQYSNTSIQLIQLCSALQYTALYTLPLLQVRRRARRRRHGAGRRRAGRRQHGYEAGRRRRHRHVRVRSRAMAGVSDDQSNEPRTRWNARTCAPSRAMLTDRDVIRATCVHVHVGASSPVVAWYRNTRITKKNLRGSACAFQATAAASARRPSRRHAHALTRHVAALYLPS
jgi:hypothetical protein